MLYAELHGPTVQVAVVPAWIVAGAKGITHPMGTLMAKPVDDCATGRRALPTGLPQPAPDDCWIRTCSGQASGGAPRDLLDPHVA